MSAAGQGSAADGGFVEPLTKSQARALDKRIRVASDRVGIAVDALLNLMGDAALGQIHQALGVSSWKAWFRDAVQLERKSLTSLMSGRVLSRGMSSSAVPGGAKAGNR